MSDRDTAAVERLGATDARMEEDRMQLTAQGMREFYGSREDSAARPKQKTRSNRAAPEPDSEVVRQTEQAGLLESLAATDGGDDGR